MAFSISVKDEGEFQALLGFMREQKKERLEEHPELKKLAKEQAEVDKLRAALAEKEKALGEKLSEHLPTIRENDLGILFGILPEPIAEPSRPAKEPKTGTGTRNREAPNRSVPQLEKLAEKLDPLAWYTKSRLHAALLPHDAELTEGHVARMVKIPNLFGAEREGAREKAKGKPPIEYRIASEEQAAEQGKPKRGGK